MAIKDLITNPHQVYMDNLEAWDFFLESYEGGHDYTKARAVSKTNQIGAINVTLNGKQYNGVETNTNLFKHKKELTEDYQQRVDMSYYYNFCSPIIDIYTNHLFKQNIDEEWGNIQGVIDKRMMNVDRKGASVDEFRKEMAELAQIYGHVFVLVDSPQNTGNILSEQDRIDNDQFPYLTLFHPQKVINWSLDQFGRPYWVVVCETRDSNIDPFVYDKENTSFIQYRLWTREGWFLFNEDFMPIDEGVHGLGQVPIVPVYNKQSKRFRSFLGISDIADIAYIARDVYNLSSELREIIRNQTFSILALQGRSSDYDELELGTSKAIAYPENFNPPQYVAPPNGPAEIITEQIKSQISKMFQLAKLEGGSVKTDQSALAQSGASKAWDFNETNASLSKKAEHLMDGEQRIWNMLGLWENKEFDGSVIYPKEFSIESVNDDLDALEKFIKNQVGNEAVKECKKAIIKKKFERMPDERVDEIVEDMESGVTPQTTNLLNRVNFLNRSQNEEAQNVVQN